MVPACNDRDITEAIAANAGVKAEGVSLEEFVQGVGLPEWIARAVGQNNCCSSAKAQKVRQLGLPAQLCQGDERWDAGWFGGSHSEVLHAFDCVEACRQDCIVKQPAWLRRSCTGHLATPQSC